jgi:hypothetical protein
MEEIMRASGSMKGTRSFATLGTGTVRRSTDIERVDELGPLAESRPSGDFGAVPRELIWSENEDGTRREALDEVVWEYPNGEEDYAGLFLRIVREADDLWIWGLVIDEEAAGENDPLLVHGAASTLERAQVDCEAAARQLMREQEVR